jgi:hypothetical protein
VFEKKNVDILPKHWPYNCTIDFHEKNATSILTHI